MTKVLGARPTHRATSKNDAYSEVEAKLPRLIKLAFDTYCARASAQESENTKDFVASQTACRAALAHFLLLVRLSDSLSRRRGESADAQDDMDNMVLEARAALGREDQF